MPPAALAPRLPPRVAAERRTAAHGRVAAERRTAADVRLFDLKRPIKHATHRKLLDALLLLDIWGLRCAAGARARRIAPHAALTSAAPQLVQGPERT